MVIGWSLIPTLRGRIAADEPLWRAAFPCDHFVPVRNGERGTQPARIDGGKVHGIIDQLIAQGGSPPEGERLAITTDDGDALQRPVATLYAVSADSIEQPGADSLTPSGRRNGQAYISCGRLGSGVRRCRPHHIAVRIGLPGQIPHARDPDSPHARQATATPGDVVHVRFQVGTGVATRGDGDQRPQPRASPPRNSPSPPREWLTTTINRKVLSALRMTIACELRTKRSKHLEVTLQASDSLKPPGVQSWPVRFRQNPGSHVTQGARQKRVLKVVEVEIASTVFSQEQLTPGALCRHPQIVLPRPADRLVPVQDCRDMTVVNEEVESAEVLMAYDAPHGLRPGSTNRPLQTQDIRRNFVTASPDPRVVKPLPQPSYVGLVHRAAREVDAVYFVDAL